jgi:hypothetical protein
MSAYNYARVRTGDFDDSHDDGGAAKSHSQPRTSSSGLGLGRFSTGSRIAGPGPGEEMLQMKMREQDSNLEALGSSVLRLGDLSLNISKEIELQNRMLDTLETETDIARDKVDILTKKTKEIIKKSGGMKNFCIIVSLVAILIVLTLLVIYT